MLNFSITVAISMLAVAMWAQDVSDLKAGNAKLSDAEQKLAQAARQKDTAGMIEWASAASAAAQKVIQAATGPDDSFVLLNAKSAVERARGYLALAAHSEGNPRNALRLILAIEKLDPKSDEFKLLLPKGLLLLRQIEGDAAAMAFAERSYARGQYDGALLIALAGKALEEQKYDKVIEYADKLMAVSRISRPYTPGMDPTEPLMRLKNMGYAQLLKGESLIAKKNFLLADTTLKVALPALRGERGLESAALFQLGIANHEVAKLSKNKARAKEAIDFYSRAADVNQDFRVLASQRISELTRTFNIK